MYTKAELGISVGGIEATEKIHTVVASTQDNTQLPDIVTFLQNRTNLTRKTIVDILVQSHTLDSFKRNPQMYMEESAKIISREMRKLLVDGIKYTKLGDSEFYAQELFINEELSGYLEKNMFPSEKSVHKYVVYDSNNEMDFAEKFEKNDAIKLYFKLPNWFKIPTPIGSYNPDWAVLIEDNGQNKFYFVIETKGNRRDEALRPTEKYKVKCGYKHFKALGDSVHFDVADNFDEFLEKHNL